MTFNEVVQEIKNGHARPVYLLHGDEPFYIDKLVDIAANKIIADSERDFNQSILYARDTSPGSVLDAVTRLPLMAEKQLVILKEAQEWSKSSQWEELENYFEKPSPTTVLVIAYKYKKFDKRSRIYKILSKTAGIVESESIKDYKIPEWIREHVKSQGFMITDKAVSLIEESVGNDLSRIANELDKLAIVIKKGEQINEKHIETHIGVSKDYNVFELVNAVLEGNGVKAQKIVNYFAQNPKATHITVVLANLHTLYQRLFRAHFARSNDADGLARQLKIHPFPAKQLLVHKSKHPAKKISRNFSILREYDMLAKGVGSTGTEGTELMKELVYRLLN